MPHPIEDTVAHVFGAKIKGDLLLSFLSKEDLSNLLNDLLASLLQSGTITREPSIINCPECGHPADHMLVKDVHYLTWYTGPEYEGQWLEITPSKSTICCPQCTQAFTPEVVEELTRR